MSDLFHDDVPDEYIERICRVMLAANWHTYQVLTKRADRMGRLLEGKLRAARDAAHIWWGVTVEDRRYGLPRIDALRGAGPNTAFLSVEPLLEHLGTVNLQGIGLIIVGGESGPGARPMDAAWVRDLRDQCRHAEVAFFFKQWGGVRKHATGRLLDGQTYDELPSLPATVAPSSEVRAAMVREIQGE